MAPPVRIEIPSIGVRAPIIRLGLNPDRTLEVPTDFGDAGWWSGGPRPGEPGPAVIVGHVDSYTGPAVFFRLRELRPHDTIVVVRRDGTRARFSAIGSEQYPKDHFPTARVYGATARPRSGSSPAGASSTAPAATTSTTRSSTPARPDSPTIAAFELRGVTQKTCLLGKDLGSPPSVGLAPLPVTLRTAGARWAGRPG